MSLYLIGMNRNNSINLLNQENVNYTSLLAFLYSLSFYLSFLLVRRKMCGFCSFGTFRFESETRGTCAALWYSVVKTSIKLTTPIFLPLSYTNTHQHIVVSDTENIAIMSAFSIAQLEESVYVKGI